MQRPAHPHLGTYKWNARPVVSHAPDCLVYINGALEISSCSGCHRTLPINRYITSVSVDLNVDSPPGSASISMTIPGQLGHDIYRDGNLIFTSMMEVEIYMKGYYLVDGVPKYYPVFWGLTTGVSDGYSGGEYKVDIACNDILYWWQHQFININPAYMHWGAFPGTNYQTFGHKFSGDNPYDIIYNISRKVFGDSITAAYSLTGSNKDRAPISQAMLLNTILYWQKRFGRIARSLVLYGMAGNYVAGSEIDTKYYVQGGKLYQRMGQPQDRKLLGATKGGIAAAVIRLTSRDKDVKNRQFDPTSTKVAAFQKQFTNAGSVEMWESTYLSKLEVAQTCAQSIGFEFFMDVDGSIVFKPPFYNVDVRGNFPVSWIRDLDIIDWNFEESDSEVITHMNMKGSWRGKINYGQGSEIDPTTALTDFRLLRKYGWRSEDFSSEYLSNPMSVFFYGMNIMDRTNSNIFTGTTTIPVRPELRLGFPVFIEPKDCFYYVKGLNHSYVRGGRCTTTLALSAKRSKFIGPQVMSKKTGPYQYESVGSGNLEDEPFVRRDQFGKIIGEKNVVMVYDSSIDDVDIDKVVEKLGMVLDPKKDVRSQVKSKLATLAGGVLERKNKGKAKFEKLDSFYRWLELQKVNKSTYGMLSGGFYKFAIDDSVSEATYLSQKNLAVLPVSDAAGYEVVGSYRYGRGITVLSEGQMAFVEGNPENPQGLDNLSVNFGSGNWGADQLASLSSSQQVLGGTMTSTGAYDRVETDPNVDPASNVGAYKESVSVVAVGNTQKGVVLESLSPEFTDPQAGTDCACTLERADNLLSLVGSGEIFNFMKSFLFASWTDTEKVVTFQQKSDAPITVDLTPAENILIGAYYVGYCLEYSSQDKAFAAHGYHRGQSFGRKAKTNGFITLHPKDTNPKWPATYPADVMWIYNGTPGVKTDQGTVGPSGSGIRLKKLVDGGMGSKYDDDFKAAGEKTGIDWKYLKAFAAVESNFKPKAVAKTRDDGQAASGLMQVLPGTAVDVDERYNLGIGAKGKIKGGVVDEVSNLMVTEQGETDAANGYLGEPAPSLPGMMSLLEDALVAKAYQDQEAHSAYEAHVRGDDRTVQVSEETEQQLGEFGYFGEQGDPNVVSGLNPTAASTGVEKTLDPAPIVETTKHLQYLDLSEDKRGFLSSAIEDARSGIVEYQQQAITLASSIGSGRGTIVQKTLMDAKEAVVDSFVDRSLEAGLEATQAEIQTVYDVMGDILDQSAASRLIAKDFAILNQNKEPE